MLERTNMKLQQLGTQNFAIAGGSGGTEHEISNRLARTAKYRSCRHRPVA
jgi:hypothetical protein